MSRSPVLRTAQRDMSLKKSTKETVECSRVESSDSDVAIFEDSDHEMEESSRKTLMDLKKSVIARRIISNSSSDTGNRSISESEVSRNLLPSIARQAFLPVKNIHYNWVFWRIYSEDIHDIYDKHVINFNSEYLTRYLLGEMFHTKVNDEEADFDASIFFQAVQIKCVHSPFEVGNGHKRLSLVCEEISTVTNSYMETNEKRREIIAQGSLVDLLISCLEIGDLLVVFGDIQVEESPFINLNSRYQHPIVMVHYRHDGNFGPVLPANKNFQDIMQPCLSGCFFHTVHEFDDNDYAIKVVPNISGGENSNGGSNRSPNLTAAWRPPRRLTQKKSKVSESVSVPEPCLLDLKQGANQTSDSDESSRFGIDIVNEIEESRILDSSPEVLNM